MNWPWGKGKQNKVTLLDSTTWSKRTKVTNNIDEGRSSETFIQLKSDIKSKIYRNYKVKRLLKFQDLKKKKKQEQNANKDDYCKLMLTNETYC
jgi:predicted SPOUT superfamily RNA methylase MTH1